MNLDASSLREAREWSLEILGLSHQATPEDALKSFLTLLPGEDFQPYEDQVQAAEFLLEHSRQREPWSSESFDNYQSHRLSEEIERLASEFLVLSIEERGQRWRDLQGRVGRFPALAHRLQGLGKALYLPQVWPSELTPEAKSLAIACTSLLTVRPCERGALRRKLYRDLTQARPNWQKPVADLKTLLPEVLALSPDFVDILNNPPVQLMPREVIVVESTQRTASSETNRTLTVALAVFAVFFSLLGLGFLDTIGPERFKRTRDSAPAARPVLPDLPPPAGPSLTEIRPPYEDRIVALQTEINDRLAGFAVVEIRDGKVRIEVTSPEANRELNGNLELLVRQVNERIAGLGQIQPLNGNLTLTPDSSTDQAPASDPAIGENPGLGELMERIEQLRRRSAEKNMQPAAGGHE